MVALPARVAADTARATRRVAPVRLPIWLSASRPWMLILAVAVPFWFATAIVTLTSFMLTVMPGETVMLLPLEARIVQQVVMLGIAIVAYRLALAIGFPREHRWRAAALQFLLALVVGLAARPILMTLGQLMMPEPEQGWAAFRNFTGWGFNLWVATTLESMLRYFFGLALLLGVRTTLALRDAELARADLENAWMTARLTALRMQLNPHFLFNAFNSVATLLDSQPQRARALVLNISDLFQRVLATADDEWTSLRDEIEFARDYMAVQKARFDDRFSYGIDAQRDALPARLPALLLQPLVENATVHGIADDRDRLHVSVEASVEASADGARRELVVSVTNRTTGRLPDGGHGHGVGLTNTHSRLAACYGDAATLVCSRPDASTYVARLRLPFEEHGR
jgi:hypothetical protein